MAEVVNMVNIHTKPKVRPFKEHTGVIYIRLGPAEQYGLSNIAEELGISQDTLVAFVSGELALNPQLKAAFRPYLKAFIKSVKGPLYAPVGPACFVCGEAVAPADYHDHITTVHRETMIHAQKQALTPSANGTAGLVKELDSRKKRIAEYERELSNIGRGWSPQKAHKVKTLKDGIEAHKAAIERMAKNNPEVMPFA